jgi:rubrerythrin
MYYTGTVKYVKEDDNGKVKKVSEQYLIEALSFAEAEINFYKFLEETIPDFSVKTLTESGITDVFEYEQDKPYWNTTIAYYLTEENGKEKLIKNKLLINAENIEQAIERTKESLSNMLVSFNIVEAKESKIVELIQKRD